MIGIVIPAFGQRYEYLVNQRSLPSVDMQDDLVALPVIGEPGDQGQVLADLRNEGVRRAAERGLEWIGFCDADDELAPIYGEAMVHAITHSRRKRPLVFVPAISYSRGRPRQAPKFWPEQPLVDGNWIPVGCVLSVELFQQVGGFRPWPMYEDWCLWQRCEKAGARFVKVPDAHYIAHVTGGSRNRGHTRQAMLAAHDMIRRANYPELYEEAV